MRRPVPDPLSDKVLGVISIAPATLSEIANHLSMTSDNDVSAIRRALNRLKRRGTAVDRLYTKWHFVMGCPCGACRARKRNAMKRTGPARVAALAAKEPPALRITATGGDLTPAASRAVASRLRPASDPAALAETLRLVRRGLACAPAEERPGLLRALVGRVVLGPGELHLDLAVPCASRVGGSSGCPVAPVWARIVEPLRAVA